MAFFNSAVGVLQTLVIALGAGLGMIIIMIPMFLLAMYERDGQPLEVIAKHFIQSKFIRPKIRPYQTDNQEIIVIDGVRYYAEYRKLRDEAQELLIAQSNIGSIYDFSDGKFRRQEEKEQKR